MTPPPPDRDRPAPFVRVVVLNYNGDPHLFRCLDALAATAWPRDRFEVVVVDNASTDGSAERVAAGYPGVELRRLTRNGGFPANNEALRDLDGVDFVALVNNDAFVTPGWLAPLVAALEEAPDLGAACPKLLFAPRFVDLAIESATFRRRGDRRDRGVRVSGVEVDGVDRWRSAQFPPPGFSPVQPDDDGLPSCWTTGVAALRVPFDPDDIPSGTVRVRLSSPRPVRVTLRCGGAESVHEVGPTPQWCAVAVQGEPYDVVQNAGSVVLEGGFGADRGFLEPDTGQYGHADEVFVWCGGGVLLRSSYLRDVGLFDERFFVYYEDTDLAWRGRARGWRYRFVPDSVIRHQHATSTVVGSALFHHYVERNRLVMFTRNAPRALVRRALRQSLHTAVRLTYRDVVAPLLRRERPRLGSLRLHLRSLAAFAGMLPVVLRDRRRLRRAQQVADPVLMSWVAPRR